MAGETDIQLPPLEVIGGNVANYGRSGRTNKLPLFTTAGGVYGHGSATLTVPMQKLRVTARVGDSFAADLTVPKQVVAARGGGLGALTVPMQVLSVTATFPLLARAALTVPLQRVYGTVRVGSMGGATLMVPMQRLSTRAGGKAGLTVPMAVLAGHITAMEYARAGLRVPLQRVSGSVVVFSYPGSAALRVPIITPGPYGIARLTVPMQAVTGSFVLPSTSGDFEAWVMNVRNAGVTRWTNFPFVHFTQMGNKTFGVGSDGNLYLLGGDLDGAAPINWTFETGIADLGSPAKKHMPYVYLGGIIDGQVEIALIDDRNRVFAYEYDTADRGAVHLTHRRKTGNGIRTVNVGYRLRSTKGAYIELDWIGPEATNTERNI